MIRKTLPNENGEGGRGIHASDGCTVSLTGSLLEENREGGLAVFDSGTEVEVSGSVIRKTLPNENGEFGRGIQASEGSTISLTGSLLEENRDIGLAVDDSGTEVVVSGSLIRETLPNKKGMHGQGLSVLAGASGTGSWCRIEGNSAGGLAAYGRSAPVSLVGVPSQLQVANSAVLQTKQSGAEIPDRGFQVFGDGVFAASGSELWLDSVVVMDSGRAGAYFLDSAGGMSDTVIAGNAAFGLAMEICKDCPYAVEYEQTGVYVFGNCAGTTAGNCVEVTTSPTGMPIPPPPEPMEVMSDPVDPVDPE